MEELSLIKEWKKKLLYQQSQICQSYQNENMKSSHFPKSERKKLEKFCPSIQGRIFQILGNGTNSYFHFEIF